MQVVLLASRMGSLTQVGFTNGDVVSILDRLCFVLLYKHMLCYASADLQYGYRMGKAALHIAGVTLARDFKKSGIPVGLIHPGVVSHIVQGSESMSSLVQEPNQK